MQKKGISLIVLVITIIVMIILAAAIIISLNNTGIIDNANKAKTETNEKTIEELANLAWGEAYANGARSVTDLKSAVEKALNENNVDSNKYGVEVTENGVTIGWKQTADKKVIKGDKVLEIGDVVNYHDAANEDKTESYTGGWQVLGVENGKIKLLSTVNVGDIVTINGYSNDKYDAMRYFTIVDELNEKSKPYGTGKGASYARSITIEDVDSITGYNKNTYGTGTINEYGSTVTYYWDNTSGKESNPYYESTNGVSGNLTNSHTKFNYCLNGQIIENAKPSSISSKQKITSITNTYYSYKLNDTGLLNGTANEKAYNLLYWNENKYEGGYWLASTYVNTYSSRVVWGLHSICGDSLNSDLIDPGDIVYSNSNYSNSSGGGFSIYTNYLRVVVVLDSNVTLTGSSSAGWNIS